MSPPPASESGGSEPAPRRRSSQTLQDLVDAHGEDGINAQQLIDRLGNQAVLLTCLIFALPPAVVPLPVAATLPGLIILILAGRLAAGLPPTLPKRLRDYHFSPKILRGLAGAGARVLGMLEKGTRPTVTWLTDPRALRRSHAGFIALAGFIMALPMPVPLANGIPSWWIIFLTVGLLERDGRYILLGYVTYVLGLAYIIAFLAGGATLVYEALDWMAWV